MKPSIDFDIACDGFWEDVEAADLQIDREFITNLLSSSFPHISRERLSFELVEIIRRERGTSSKLARAPKTS